MPIQVCIREQRERQVLPVLVATWIPESLDLKLKMATRWMIHPRETALDMAAESNRHPGAAR
jgi:hypothetical protein